MGEIALIPLLDQTGEITKSRRSIGGTGGFEKHCGVRSRIHRGTTLLV
jgi:hypothetical protein